MRSLLAARRGHGSPHASGPEDRPDHLIGLPFVCTGPDGRGDLAELHRARVVQCALSRVCAVCAQTLDRPLHLVGTAAEADDNAFRLPPAHAVCVDALLEPLRTGDGVVLGHGVGPTSRWSVVVTGGFDLVRPETRDGLHLFRPNAVLERRDLA
ncbi:hypothetical protein RDV89_00635 [Nocardioides zeae]|uniref:Uncharacterized protein n=1 Tax=Nocardioides imazamoxiresistens TaxID=3231893 RepID=A0ABU3PRP9_9ACTN|nr:hypothetical protein [Nocardioides zeae]MDT9591552.1 hypothetical protein [Nocardioides zeae]